MKAISRVALTALLVFAATFSAAAAGTVSGTVNNGTTNTPVRGTEVILMQLQGGMEPVATTKTDASGHFSITNDAL
ncbi:MAG TPA: hypothetical protein VKS00_06340, partial [Candidatus Acidoferrales bacterium]|nr:hypothetical protein [Candidatus Acidoferrales bacterium]